jgi:hypothetical protein
MLCCFNKPTFCDAEAWMIAGSGAGSWMLTLYLCAVPNPEKDFRKTDYLF